MSRTHVLAAATAAAVLVLLSSTLGSQGTNSGPAGFRVRSLAASRTVDVTDKSLADWDAGLVVLDVGPAHARDRQLETINGRSPLLLRPGDAGLKVYMAVDHAFWYVAAEVVDDVVVQVPASSVYPYSGDSLEVFFAGKNVESGADIHDHVINPLAGPNQAAFFQLDIPATTLTDPMAYLPDWRTDPTIRRTAPRAGLVVSVWRTKGGWSAEARMPRGVFERGVQGSIEKHAPLRLNISLLDYDTGVAPRNAAGFFGFNPDNVITLEREQHRLSVPRYMRTLVFE